MILLFKLMILLKQYQQLRQTPYPYYTSMSRFQDLNTEVFFLLFLLLLVPDRASDVWIKYVSLWFDLISETETYLHPSCWLSSPAWPWTLCHLSLGLTWTMRPHGISEVFFFLPSISKKAISQTLKWWKEITNYHFLLYYPFTLHFSPPFSLIHVLLCPFLLSPSLISVLNFFSSSLFWLHYFLLSFGSVLYYPPFLFYFLLFSLFRPCLLSYVTLSSPFFSPNFFSTSFFIHASSSLLTLSFLF